MFKSLALTLLCLVLIRTSCTAQILAQAKDQPAASAIQHGQFRVDIPGVIGRSDIVLGRANVESDEAMPLGNGSLGVAMWMANGLTAQLNRNDTLPDRLASGQVVIPGLAVLTRANDYSGRLDLYSGEFQVHGGGLTATAFVETNHDALVIEVSGADPDQFQTAVLKLWIPRTPYASVESSVGLLVQSWVDTAQGREVTAKVTDPLTVTISFKPNKDGHFRVVVASPHYDGTGRASAIAAKALAYEPNAVHVSWWAGFWKRAALIKITSKDGAGEYMENLRNLYLFVAAIEKGAEYPGSQAGIADMISAAKDEHRWDSSAFWHWNLRMQVAANIGAGVPELNDTYFNLYRENLASIEDWTRKNMKGLPGICVPETMRFNGPGIEYESTWKPITIGRNCDASFKPYYNARTISTGAEISLWVWRQYLATVDRKFLAENYPLMAASARFLLAYQKMGQDGLLHTSPSNAHETQWDVTDPTTDVAAIRALYPATIEAAHLLGKDAGLVRQLRAAIPKLPPLPRTQQTPPHTLLTADADRDTTDVIAESHMPAEEDHNIENIGLEPVWPFAIIGDTSPLFQLAQRTYAHRPNISAVDWSLDPIQAARLGLGSEVATTLIATTQRFQGFVNGMAKWEPTAKEFYVEQTGVVADALQEALVQDYDGTIRIAPAIPPGWDFDGSIYVRGKSKVDVQTRSGAITRVVIEAGSTRTFKIRNPWPGKPIDVIEAQSTRKIAASNVGPVIEFQGTAGKTYLVESPGTTSLNSAVILGAPATVAKKLGPVQIGLFANSQ
jgi:hypothetical protein